MINFLIRLFLILLLGNIVQADTCLDSQSECVEKGGVRIVDGIKVHRDCWRYRYIKECKSDVNSCKNVSGSECNLKNEECNENITVGSKKFCANTKKTYHCQHIEEYQENKTELVIDDLEASKQLLCDAFCLGGDCDSVRKAKPVKDPDMANSIAQLQMLKDVKDGLVDKDRLLFNIFKGENRGCSTIVTNFTRCCSNSGWAKNLGLVSCKAEEVKLAEDNSFGKCIYLGEVCTGGEIFGICLKKTKRYCCYPNVLSKIIQIGARKQLGKTFGMADSPDCQGITLEELRRVDFSKIDFKEFFDRDVAPRIKDYKIEDLQKIMQKSIPKMKNGLSED